MDFPGWDPVLLDLPGPIDIRWYGLMFIVGFVAAQSILVRLARAGFFPVKPEVAPDLIYYCVFGVILGGRTGYVLFYDRSLLHPLEFVQVFNGGLSFHGGLTGVGVAVLLFCRKHKVRWLQVADACAFACTPGIFAVRMANFINGELYGRVTSKDTPFAMQFPTDPQASQLFGLPPGLTMRDRELCLQVAFGRRQLADVQPALSATDGLERPIDWAAVAPRLDWPKIQAQTLANGDPAVPFRHPSQIYEGVGEGPVLALALVALHRLLRGRAWSPGTFTAAFLCGYAAIRWSLELVRQPDAQLGADVFLGMTMGQTLSVGMLVAGGVILAYGRRHRGDAARR